jgi:hypothetical protein
MWRAPLTPCVGERVGGGGLSVMARASGPGAGRRNASGGRGNTPEGTGELFRAASRLRIKDGPGHFDLGKLLRAGGDPRRGSAHRLPAP